MKTIRYIIYTMLCVMGITACQDDLMNRTSEGADVNKPVQVDLKFAVPNSMQVEVTRADNSKSTISSLRLYVFNANSHSLLKAEDVSVTNGRVDSQGRYYATTATLYEGEQNVYAIANQNTTLYWKNPQSALDEAAERGETAFLNTLYALQDVFTERNSLPTLTEETIPLTGEGKVTVTNGSTSDIVVLKRPMAQVRFNIAMNYQVPQSSEDSERRGHKVSFTPDSYSIYRVAGKSYVVGAEDDTRNVAEDVYYDVPTPPVNIDISSGDTAKISGFYIPENIQKAKNTCTKYDDREAFDSSQGTADGKKSWTNAPDNGTYVVIHGKYVETDANGLLFRSADVSYTIHLGDWREGAYDDFSVKRNFIYTYTMSVRGVDNIVVEATSEEDSDEFQNGAEGDVIELTEGSEVFYLDSHYEQVFVSYNLSEIAERVKEDARGDAERVDELIAQSFMLSIHSPMNNVLIVSDELMKPYTDDESKLNGLDYKWIQFYPQSGEDITSYVETRDEDMLNPWDACKKMGQAVKKLVEDPDSRPSVEGLEICSVGGEYYARFTAFLDEYFYTEDLNGESVDWADFTRTDARTLLIASNWQSSPDKNSTYATARTYIAQSSIMTFYNPASSYNTNALGVESYNEYGVITGFGDLRQSNFGRSETNGRANMIANTSSDRTIDFTKIGYTKPNATTGNSWSLLSERDKEKSAFKACLARNRDLNRNGKIDDEEIRWYLPARSQYLRMGIGANSLGSAALFSGDKASITEYPFGADWSLVGKGSLYYSNTPSPESDDPWELYWAIEVGAYGSNRKPDPNGPELTQYGYRAQIRCVRNLPSAGHLDTPYDDGALAGPVYGELRRLESLDKKNYIFDFGDRLDDVLYRHAEQTRPYSEHNETSTANMLPAAFVVSSDYIISRRGTPMQYTVAEAYSSDNNPCADYYETQVDRGKWRVPNLSELTVMSTVAEELGMDKVTLSSTQFSNPNVRCAFNFNGTIITAWDKNSENTKGYIRCVRDATQAEINAIRR